MSNNNDAGLGEHPTSTSKISGWKQVNQAGGTSKTAEFHAGNRVGAGSYAPATLEEPQDDQGLLVHRYHFNASGDHIGTDVIDNRPAPPALGHQPVTHSSTFELSASGAKTKKPDVPGGTDKPAAAVSTKGRIGASYGS